MKKILILFSCILFSAKAFANIDYINIDKISKEEKYTKAFKYIKDNTQYYSNWSPEWKHEVSKKEIKNNLEKHYKTFSGITQPNIELELLLGDISHYLYNLDDQGYYDKSVSHYHSAIRINPKDYRSYWFLGSHYSASNVPDSAFSFFNKAKDLLPENVSADFWEEYAFSTYLSGMPSHCIYAMDKVRLITGKPGYFEKTLGAAVNKNLEDVDKNESYKKEDIWRVVEQDDQDIFTSRAMGVSISIDSSWGMDLYDYENNTSGVALKPNDIISKSGKQIGYSILLLIQTGGEKDNIESILNPLIEKYHNKTKIDFSKKYDQITAYEIKDKNIYPEAGGAHMYIMCIERQAPIYPGLILESPIKIKPDEKGKTQYYVATAKQNRFEGKIFYILLLDTCEDIHDESLRIFKTFFNDQMVIE